MMSDGGDIQTAVVTLASFNQFAECQLAQAVHQAQATCAHLTAQEALHEDSGRQ